MPHPHALPPNAVGITVQNNDCAAARRSAGVISQALGFSEARVTCAVAGTLGTLTRPRPPRMPPVRNLITYSVPETNHLPTPSAYPAFEVPSDIPWVSTTGAVIAYVKLDALIMTVRVDNMLKTGFALENAGILQSDMMVDPRGTGGLVVRVRPITSAQVQKIIKVAASQLHDPFSPSYHKVAFVQDCDGTIASLSGLSLAVARERARVMARAAKTTLGPPLGVVDLGGDVTDAVCGLGRDATLSQLSAAPENWDSNTEPGLRATVVRSVSAAWRLKLPPNPAGASWRLSPDLRASRWSPSSGIAFVADGMRSETDAIMGNAIVPDRVDVVFPDWAFEALQKSRYAPNLTDIGLNISPPLLPAVVIRAANADELSRGVKEVQAYASQLALRSGKHFDLWYYYSRSDCRSVTDAALFKATSDAVAGLHGTKMRYLQETALFASGSIPCLYEPIPGYRQNASATQRGDMAASVVVGY